MSLAWELNNRTTELKSYENLSIDYYYDDDLQKAKFYHERFIKGQVEKINSVSRKAN